MKLPSYRWRFAHLAALWGYGVSQPVFSLLKGNPEFLVFNGASRIDTVTFAIALALGPPFVALLLEAAASVISRAIGAIVHLVAVAVFGFLVVLQVLAQFDPTSAWTMLIPAALAYAGAIAYLRWSAVRLFLSWSLALPILGLLSFVTTTPLVVDDAEASSVNVPSRTPVVLLVLDELPLSSLMTASGAIDAQRYPGFGRLARGATWYSRATTVADHTTYAVPAILSGQAPENSDLPTLADYPDNLFTLLGGTYRVRAHEPVTRLCPVRYCPAHRTDISLTSRLKRLFHDAGVDYLVGTLPAAIRGDGTEVAEGWRVHLENTRLEGLDFFRAIKPTDPLRTLYFLHVLQPHQPWALLPSGHHYNDPWVVAGVKDDWDPGEDKRWRTDELLVKQGLQHHLLQVRAVDRLIGTMIDELRRRGLYDRALVIVTADHGASFRAGGWIRRTTFSNVSDVASVPLFVKYPGEKGGREDRRAAATIDVVPTIADVLGVNLPRPVDGTSLRKQPIARDVRIARLKRSALVVRPERVASQILRVARRNSEWLGQGKGSLFRIGPRQDLLGRSAAALPSVVINDARVTIPRLGDLENVRKRSGYVPVHFLGQIAWKSLRATEDVAIAVNGRIAAVTRPYRADGDTWVDAMIDETLVHDGRNRVAVYAVRGSGTRTQLLHLGGNADTPRKADADHVP